ncbi:hypothetical protein ABGB07_34065 [Micromonosporaceae bacterium B7E4]
MISENSGDRQEPRGLPKFAYDVGVNLLANLVAAAIIYLLGALAGILPRVSGLIGTALFVVLATLIIGGVIILRFLSWGGLMEPSWLPALVGGAAVAGALINPGGHWPEPTWVSLALGTCMVLIGAANLLSEWRFNRRHRAAMSNEWESQPQTPDGP